MRSSIITDLLQDASIQRNKTDTFLTTFNQIVTRFGDKVAVEFGEVRLTYHDLDRFSNALAAEIRQRQPSAVKNGIIAVCIKRSPEFVVAQLAAFKVGAAYLPLDPAYPVERLRFMLEDSAATLVLTGSDSESSGLKAGAAQLHVSLEALARSTDCAEHTHVGPARDDRAYVIYTSGSTGKPKGVEVAHGPLDNFLQAMRRRPSLSSTDRVLHATTPSFDISIAETLLPLSCGATVIIADDQATRDFSRLARLIASHAPTVVQATPTAFTQLLPWLSSRSTLRLWCGGEQLTRALAEKLLTRCAELWNLYGPTEATIWCSAHHYTGTSTEATLPIGEPLDNTSLFVLNEDGSTAAPGATGELFVGGACLANGYLGRPELTADRFVYLDQFPGLRLYKTGDAARYGDDGTIEVLGRLDFQVKIRGHRIELGEIESVLQSHPAVRSAAVVAVDGSAGRELVAFVDHDDVDQVHGAGDVDRWRSAYEAIYNLPGGDDGSVARQRVWQAPTTRKVLSEEVLATRLDTLSRYVCAGPHTSILEVGCGQGDLVHRLLGQTSRYVATDVAEAAVQGLRKRIGEGNIQGTDVTFLRFAAHEIDQVPHETFDVILANSVVQYFPSAGYVLSFLAALGGLLNECGRILLCDLIDPGPKGNVDRAESINIELQIRPSFFVELADLTGWFASVTVRPAFENSERLFGRLRYDVILEKTALQDARILAVCESLAGDFQECIQTGLDNHWSVQALSSTNLCL